MIYRGCSSTRQRRRRGSLSNVGSVVAAMTLVIFGSSVQADVTEMRDEENRRAVVTYKMTVTPAVQPKPLLKHRFTVLPMEKIPGNAITHYLRSLGENSLDSPNDYVFKTYGVEAFSWYGTEIKTEDIPVEKLRDACKVFDGYIENHLRRATFCRDCDWGLAEETLRGKETIGFLLPSVQQTRSMARALMLRNRLAIIDGRYEDSIDHLRMTYQLGQNTAKMKFLVSALVGFAEVGMANEGLLHLIAAKDSPNMYWAIAELPHPIISIREALRLESSFATRYFPVLENVETAKHSPEQWSELLADLTSSFTEISGLTGGRRSKKTLGMDLNFLAAGAGLVGYPQAKKRLLESGMESAEVEKMAVAHVMLLDAARDYRQYADAVEAAYYLPFTEFKTHSDKWENRMRTEGTPGRLGAMLANMLLPAVMQVRIAEERVNTQINALLAVEAIRDHLATHGKFPMTLDEMELPVRLNTNTGKPFGYEVKGETAILDVKTRNANYRYEIQMATGK
ncbi:MAG: hypothetical protein AB8B55_15855 [Mariniblastus sp.]